MYSHIFLSNSLSETKSDEVKQPESIILLFFRVLEVVKMKCAYNEKELWPYMMQVRD